MPDTGRGKKAEEEIASPCVDVCEIKDGLCMGCMRTVEEIRAWKTSGNAEKLSIIARAEKRKNGD